MKMTDARVLAFKLLYSLEMQKEDKKEQIDLFMQANEIDDDEVKKYINDINEGVIEKENVINELIQKNLKESWNMSRISKIDLAILKLGIYEMIYREVPYKVVINETVELAKKYGEDTSGNFINGIFASIVREKKFAEDKMEDS
ncbi:MAG: transcription antitermination factor NusB [Clostridia bacterium]|nr:transcription antitermination factor NusB [Clostridia bacterium]